ncbi:MAG: hypothetical protein WC004_04095 [Candidatus Absconditabacterales bacterium]
MFIKTVIRRIRNIHTFFKGRGSVLRMPRITISKHIHKRFIWQHAKQIIRDGLFQFFGISILVGFLLYLLHILLGLSFGVQQLSENIQHKLGAYFYIKDIPGKADETYSKVIDMKDKLEKLGMQVTYLSKDDAIKSVGRRVPSVIESFEKYGIKNPLPATMYVLFNDIEQYDKLRKVVSMYEDIIANRDAISKTGEGIKEQERRILDTLGFTRFIVYLTYFLVIVLVVVIVSFLMLVVRTKFNSFHKLVSIQQLLGTDYFLIKTPFIITSIAIVVLGFLLSLLFFGITLYIIQGYTAMLFEASLIDIIGLNAGLGGLIFVAELLLFTILTIGIGYLYLQQLLLKSTST